MARTLKKGWERTIPPGALKAAKRAVAVALDCSEAEAWACNAFAVHDVARMLAKRDALAAARHERDCCALQALCKRLMDERDELVAALAGEP